jgi:ABC-type multidrug transport system fused ATPase/permease subunit
VKRILENYQQEHAELELGEINTKLAKLPIVMLSWFERVKNYIIPYMLVFLFAICYFLYQDIWLGLGLFTIIAIFSMFMIGSPVSCLDISVARDKCFNKIHETVDDVLRNLFSVFGSSQEEAEMANLKSVFSEYNVLYRKTIECVSKLKFWITPLIISYLIFFAYRCYALVHSKKMNSASFVPLFIILLYILGSMKMINEEMRDITIEWGIIEGSSDILESKPVKIPIASNNISIPHEGIGFANVSFTYPGTHRRILDDITLHINDGERVCIVGDIGSGKSTIIKLLMKYHINDTGVIYYQGKNYNDVNVKYVRKHLGYVPQQPTLFNRSIIDNILYGNNTHTKNDVIEYLKSLGIHDEFQKLDKGYDTIIGKNGSKLSGGQRQLVWCLRVLLKNPDVIILDEPTASVDEKTKNILYRLLNDIMKDKTTIMISHDPYLVNISSRVIHMKHGKIIKDHRQ